MTQKGINHTDREHASFSPSAAERWLQCPLSVWLTENIEAPERPAGLAAAQGTLMHEKAEEFLANWKPVVADGPLIGEHNVDGDMTLVDVPASEWTMHVGPYVRMIRECYEAHELCGYEPTLMIEQRVEIVGKHCFGTLDAAVYVPGVALDVFDLKTGRKTVDGGADQFGVYGLGLLKKFGEDPAKCVLTTNVGQAINPSETTRWTWSPRELADLEKRINESIKKGTGKKQPDPTPDPHESCCTWCPRREHCSYQQGKMAQAIDALTPIETESEGFNPPSPSALSPEQRAFILEYAKDIEKFIKALGEDELKRQLEGKGSPKFKVVHANTRRKYNPDMTQNEIIDHLELVGLDATETKLLPFSKVEKEAKAAGINIDHLLVKPEGGPKLVPANASGKTYNPAAALSDLPEEGAK